MANWRKKNERWQQRVHREVRRWQAMTADERASHYAKMNPGTDAENDGYVTDGRTFDDMAREVMAREPESSLQWALAHAQLQKELWCGLDDAVLSEQDRQRKMRRKYGAAWSGRVKMSRFAELGDEDKKRRPWKTVRWLESRGFVTVGDGHVTWVGPVE